MVLSFHLVNTLLSTFSLFSIVFITRQLPSGKQHSFARVTENWWWLTNRAIGEQGGLLTTVRVLGGFKKVSSHHWERNKPSQILLLLLLLHLKLFLQVLHANKQQENINLVIRTARTSPFIFGGHNYKIVKKEREKNKTLGLSNCTACIFFFPVWNSTSDQKKPLCLR